MQDALRDAILNQRLANAWEDGAYWAATDYYGIAFTEELCLNRKSELGQVCSN